MNNWVVVVKRRGNPKIRRVFVEEIEYEDEAIRLALLKLGVSPQDYDARTDLIDERVSIENPMDNAKELYEQVRADLIETEQELHNAETLAAAYLERAEKAETERDVIDLVEARELKASINKERHRWAVRAEKAEMERDILIRHNTFALSNLALIKSTVEKVQKVLEKGTDDNNERWTEKTVH